jgi:hypothetical protein
MRTPHRFLDEKVNEKHLDPGDQPATMEERWQRDVDGRPSLENEDLLLDALKRHFPRRWKKLCEGDFS